jgi:hypothetical protein
MNMAHSALFGGVTRSDPDRSAAVAGVTAAMPCDTNHDEQRNMFLDAAVAIIMAQTDQRRDKVEEGPDTEWRRVSR